MVFVAALLVLSISLLGLSVVHGAQLGRAQSHTAGAPGFCTRATHGIVYAREGRIERVQPDRSGRCVLMQTLGGHTPVLARDGRLLAFVARPDGGLCAGCGRVVVARVGSHPHVLLTTRVSGPGLTGAPAWSPDGRRLAFLQDPNLRVWDVRCRCSPVVIHGTRDRPIGSFAWSPDSRRIAAAHVARYGAPGLDLPITIASLPARKQQTVKAQLPSWVGRPHMAGSYPSALIGWTAGNRLLVQTSGPGLGRELTGIWSAPPGGGMSRKVLAIPRHGRLTPASPLWNATEALLAPDHTHLLLERVGNFWVGTATGRQVGIMRPADRSDCPVTQLIWSGRNRLTYVTVCNTGRPEKPARLFTASTAGGRAVLLDSVRSRQQDALSIAAPILCIACGAG